MAIEFPCSKCGRWLRTGDDTAGKQAMCPECGAVTPIPAAVGGGSSGPAGAPSWQSGDLGGSQPMPAPFAAPARGGIRPTAMELGDVFARTWSIFKRQWRMCLTVVVIVLLLSIVVNIAAEFAPGVGPILVWLFGIWLTTGQALFFLKTARGEEADVSDIFTGWPFFFRVIGANFLFGLMMLGIILLLVLPMLAGAAVAREAMVVVGVAGGVVAVAALAYVSLAYSQFYYLILDRKANAIESFGMSREIMEGNKLTLLGIGALSILITIAAAIPCFVGLFVAIPYFQLMQAVIYLTVTGQPTADMLKADPAAME